MGLILALDQGATKTAALVASPTGEMLGVGYGGGACHASDGMDTAMAAVRQAAGAALATAGAQLADVGLLLGGMTGADWPREYPLLENALRQATGVPEVAVVNDCIIARRAGTDSPWGAVLCAGTGLNAAVTSPQGESYIYGYYINGDDHGGTALGRLSLRAVFGAESGIGPATQLTGLLLRHFALTTVDDLLDRYVRGELGPTSALVPLFTEAVRAGDPVAVGILHDFGQRLARYVTVGLRRFDLTGAEPPVVLSGGIFKAGLPGLRASISRAIQREAPGAMVLDAPYEPVVGALLLALERMGLTPVSLAAPAIKAGAARHHLERVCPA